MKRSTLSILVFMLAIVVLSQEVEIFEKNSKYGIKLEGKTILKPTYDDINYLYGKYFSAKNKGTVGGIDIEGKTIIPFIYDDILLFSDNLLLVNQKGKWGLIDNQNKVILSISYVGFNKLNDYLYIIKDEKLRTGLINKFGQIKQYPSFDSIETYVDDNLYFVECNGKRGIINHIGETVIPAEYTSIEFIGGELYKVSKNGKFGIIDYNGKIIINSEFDNISNSQYGMWIIEANHKIGFITKKFQVIPPIYDKILFYQSRLGIIALKQNGKCGFITKEGKVIPAIYDNISRFAGDGKAIVEKNGRLMKVDYNGNELNL